MKYLKTFETYTTPIPRAVEIETETNLMDIDVDKELTQEEIEELKELDEEIEKAVKGKRNQALNK